MKFNKLSASRYHFIRKGKNRVSCLPIYLTIRLPPGRVTCKCLRNKSISRLQVLRIPVSTTKMLDMKSRPCLGDGVYQHHLFSGPPPHGVCGKFDRFQHPTFSCMQTRTLKRRLPPVTSHRAMKGPLRLEAARKGTAQIRTWIFTGRDPPTKSTWALLLTELLITR